MSGRARFTVSGPLEEDHAVPSLGAGLSCAQTYANRRRRDPGEWSYYVRDGDGVGRAIVTKTAGGIIETRLHVAGIEFVERTPAETRMARSELETPAPAPRFTEEELESTAEGIGRLFELEEAPMT